jgi:hypothetical protein
MKNITFIVFLLLFFGAAQGQTSSEDIHCFINISYDANGNRISRAKACSSGSAVSRPTPTDSTGNVAAADATDRMAAIAGTATDAFAVYPNPTAGQVHISLDAQSLQAACSLSVATADGKILLRKAITSPLTTLSLAAYANGIYWVILHRGSRVNTVKISKESGEKPY